MDILHAETHFPAFICSKIKEKMGIPYIFDMQGLRAEEMKQRGEPKALIDFWDSAEKKIVKDADCVIVVSGLMKEYVGKYFGKPLDQMNLWLKVIHHLLSSLVKNLSHQFVQQALVYNPYLIHISIHIDLRLLRAAGAQTAFTIRLPDMDDVQFALLEFGQGSRQVHDGGVERGLHLIGGVRVHRC